MKCHLLGRMLISEQGFSRAPVWQKCVSFERSFNLFFSSKTLCSDSNAGVPCFNHFFFFFCSAVRGSCAQPQRMAMHDQLCTLVMCCSRERYLSFKRVVLRWHVAEHHQIWFAMDGIHATSSAVSFFFEIFASFLLD